MANNVGDQTDSSGQVATDFVWGNFPMQPNDDRATTAAGNYAASGISGTTISGASSTASLSTFTTTAAHGLSVGQVVNTGTFAIGGTVAVPVAGTTVGATTATPNTGAGSVTANTDNNTITIVTAANHNVLPGQVVAITSTVSTAFTGTTTIYQGTFIAQPGTATTNLILNNSNALNVARAATLGGFTTTAVTGTAVAMPNISTAGTVTVYHYDLNNATVVSVPSTTSFTVASGLGYANSASITFTNKTASLEAVGDLSWAVTTKVQSSRLDATKDGHSIVEGSYYGFPSLNTGLYKVTAATADGTRVWYTAPNNLKVNDVVSITGLTDGAVAGTSTLNLANQTVVAATADNFLILNAAAAKTITPTVAGSAAIRYFDEGIYQVTAASGNGTTVTYTSQNSLIPGATVSVTGLTTSAFNLSAATVATANAVSFTVTNGAGNGVSITGQTGKVANDTAASVVDGAFVAGTAALNGVNYQTSTAYVQVPNVVGLTTANALDGLLDRGLVATSSGTTSSTAKNITAVTRAAGSTLAVCTLTTHGLLEGHVVTASSSSLAGITNTVQYRVLYKIDADTFVINTSASTVLASGTVTLTPVVGTVYSQSIAAGAATTASGTAITVNNWIA